MIIKRILAASAAVLLGMSLAAGTTARAENTMSALEFAAEMKQGWNLGNTFDAPKGETAWGNPKTTPELIHYVKELGFETIRIPISWGLHTSPAPEYTIDETFMARVDTVVREALDSGLHVIINSHHDNDFYSPTAENREQANAYLSAIWTQVGAHFADAPYTLIFETMNEPRVTGTSFEWGINLNNQDCLTALEIINELNQTALDAIRASGGNNLDRFVMVTPYAASPGSALSSTFSLPQDSAQDKLLLSLHSYTPYSFALDIHSGDTDFGRKDEFEITSMLKNVNHRYVEKGIGVVFGEMGCLDKGNPEDRYAWCKTFVSSAQSFGIPCVWWDNGCIGTNQENFGLINRRNLSIYPQSETVYQGLMDGLKGTE